MSLFRRRILLVPLTISVGLLDIGAYAQEDDDSGWIPEEIHAPTLDYHFCNRNNISYICNPDMILSQSACDQFDNLTLHLQQTSRRENLTCGQGYEFASLWVTRMKGWSKPAQFARTVHDRWGVGDPECLNGVLLFVSIEDREIYISVGEDALSSSEIQDVVQIMRAPLRAGDYDEGLRVGSQRIVEFLMRPGKESEDLTALWIVLGIVGGMALLTVVGMCVSLYALILVNNQKKEYKAKKSAHRAVTQIRDDYHRARSRGKWSSPDCPICLEEYGLSTKTLQCGHRFDQECLERWFQTQDKERTEHSCPICRYHPEGKEEPPQQPGYRYRVRQEASFRMHAASLLYPGLYTYPLWITGSHCFPHYDPPKPPISISHGGHSNYGGNSGGGGFGGGFSGGFSGGVSVGGGGGGF